MTREQFRDCFVGERGFDSLKTVMKNGYDLSIELSKLLQERSDIETVYSRSLRKNGEALQKLANRATGSLLQALAQIANQTNIESQAHKTFANEISVKISTPMKNLAETQSKARKPTEDAIVSSLKTLKEKRATDMKYRQRHFENCRDIEDNYKKMDEIPRNSKTVAKETNKIELALRKVEQELEKTDAKYHEATKQLEAARQSFDIEMCRGCDVMQTMEFSRICEIQKFIQIYTDGLKNLNISMSQVQREIDSIKVNPEDDIISEATSNIQTTTTEILLYDIFAETEPSNMSQERRVLSLMNWIRMLKQDIDIQRRSKDGIDNLQGFCQQNRNFSSALNANDIYTNQQRVRLLLSLYEASLYKFEKVYNKIKKLPEPPYENSDCLKRTFTEKNTPTTHLEIPFQALTQVSVQAPSPVVHLARSAPILEAEPQVATPQSYMKSMHVPYPMSASQPTIGWAVSDSSSDPNLGDAAQMVSPCPYPVSSDNLVMSDRPRSANIRRVQVLYSYDAQHHDELDIRPGDIIVLLETRSDGWYKGTLGNKSGLFPGNHVQEI